MRQCRPFSAGDHIQIGDKKYLYLNDDDPIRAYSGNHKYDPTISFVAQPLKEKSHNKIIVVPLVMTDEWAIINNHLELITKLRSTHKHFLFNFVGQTDYRGRGIFKSLSVGTNRLKSYDFESTAPIWSVKQNEKDMILMRFLKRIACAKFVFAPRGDGSSSFRAYQAMAAGSVPVIMDMVSYPFDNEVNWDTICLRGSLSEIDQLIDKALTMTDSDYRQMRRNAMQFWDEYCLHSKLYDKLCQLVLGAT